MQGLFRAKAAFCRNTTHGLHLSPTTQKSYCSSNYFCAKRPAPTPIPEIKIFYPAASSIKKNLLTGKLQSRWSCPCIGKTVSSWSFKTKKVFGVLAALLPEVININISHLGTCLCREYHISWLISGATPGDWRQIRTIRLQQQSVIRDYGHRLTQVFIGRKSHRAGYGDMPAIM